MERVRVYEKLRLGICADNGVFHLVDSWQESDEHRRVFKFRLGGYAKLFVLNQEYAAPTSGISIRCFERRF
jgi:hypothetical protein